MPTCMQSYEECLRTPVNCCDFVFYGNIFVSKIGKVEYEMMKHDYLYG